MMKVSFVVPSISSTVLGVVTNHARILAKDYDVQIVGPDTGAGVCPLYKDVWPYTVIKAPHIYRVPDFFSDIQKIGDAIEGDIVISVKSFAQTVLPVLRQKKRFGKKIMVYLDEWDGALYQRVAFKQKIQMWIRHLHHPVGEHYVPLMERRFRQFDSILCSSEWLAQRFHGRIVHFGVDTELFNPENVNEIDDVTWSRLGLMGKKVLLFGGVVRPHKGVEQILEALCLLNDDTIRLLIVGPENEHVQDMKRNCDWAKWLVCSDVISKDKMPSWIKKGDAVILPLCDDLLGQTQIPCKMFEAMAMGKAIIATNVSDLGKILHECGMVIPPDNIGAVSEAISNLLGNAKLVEKMGQKAREKCICEFSAMVVKEQFVQLFE